MLVVADHEHPVGAATAAPRPVEPQPGQVAAEQEQPEAERQNDRHETPGQLDLPAVADEGDHGGQPDAGVADPPELLGSAADEAGLVAAAQRQDHQPQHGQARGNRGVRHPDQLAGVCAEAEQ